jgi:hypothetical protein
MFGRCFNENFHHGNKWLSRVVYVSTLSLGTITR